MFDMLTDEFASGPNYIGNTALADIRAKAHSGAAQAYWDEWCIDTDEQRAENYTELHRFQRPFNPAGELPYASLVFAAVHATHAIELGLVSATVLWVGRGVKNVVERVGGDTDKIVQFRPLWDVLRRRDEECVSEERRRREKVAKGPNAYVCAAEGCKVEGLHKSALRACGGRCPPDLKPHYCSKECQKRVSTEVSSYQSNACCVV